MAEPAENEGNEPEATSSAEMPAPPPPPPPPLRSVRADLFATESAVMTHGAAAAQSALTGVKSGIERAKKSLERRNKDWERAAAGARLPAVQTDAPMADLATRQDSEATFWRGFAMRTMKPGVPQFLATAAGTIGLAGGVGLAILAGLRGLLGGGASAPQLWAGAGVLATGVSCALLASFWLHRVAQRSIDEALARADAAERRLTRTAAILALRHADEAAYKDALIRLERG